MKREGYGTLFHSLLSSTNINWRIYFNRFSYLFLGRNHKVIIQKNICIIPLKYGYLKSVLKINDER